MNSLAKFFSIVLHPLLMPTYFVFMLFNSGTVLSFMSLGLQLMIYGVVFFVTFLLPLLLMPIFLKMQIIQSFNMETHKERIGPMIVTVFLFLFCCTILYRIPVPIPSIIKLYMIASTCSVLFTLAITTKWKISAHMVGIGGNTGAIITLSLKLMSSMIPILLALIILSGLLGSARLQLKAHSAEQVYAGYGLGLATVMLIILFF